MFGNNAPDGAEILALLGMRPTTKHAPTLARPKIKFAKPRFVPTGSISAPDPSIRNSIQQTLAGVLSKAINERQAHRLASRAMAPLTDATPLGNVTGAEEGGKQFYRGLTKGDARTAGLGALSFGLSVLPVPGGVKKAARKTGLFGSLMKDEAGAIRAWHGSPHDFDKFEWSPRTRGTGEGAQAYGDGLYFAENPEVARQYQLMLSNKTGVNARTYSLAQMAQKQAPDDPRTFLHREAMQMPPSQRQEYFDAVNNFDEVLNNPPGRLYEVNINAEPEDFLDWDADVTGKVAETIRGLGIEPSVADRWYPMPRYEANEVRRWHNNGAEVAETANGFIAGHNGKAIGTFPTLEDAQAAVPIVRQPLLGSETYQRLGGSLDGRTAPRGWRQEAADKLLGAGIPGIRFLDQGSRSAGQGTRNFVVFDDSLIDILGKY